MEITGRLTKKFDTAKVSDKFQKREFILTIEENTPYPQPLSMQLTQDKCATLDLYNEDDEIKVHFNLRGRHWQGPQGDKWFNTIDVWRIKLVAKGAGQSMPVVSTKSDAEKQVEEALAKMSPEARTALQKVIDSDNKPTVNAVDDNKAALNTGDVIDNDDNLDLPF